MDYSTANTGFFNDSPYVISLFENSIEYKHLIHWLRIVNPEFVSDSQKLELYIPAIFGDFLFGTEDQSGHYFVITEKQISVQIIYTNEPLMFSQESDIFTELFHCVETMDNVVDERLDSISFGKGFMTSINIEMIGGTIVLQELRCNFNSDDRNEKLYNLMSYFSKYYRGLAIEMRELSMVPTVVKITVSDCFLKSNNRDHETKKRFDLYYQLLKFIN